MAFLPPGFDPATGRLSNIGGASAPVRTNTASSYSRTTSFWEGFNDAIIEVGNWIADVIDNISNVVMWIILVISWISAIIAAISVFIDEGIFWGIVACLFGGTIVYYGSFIIAGIAYLAVKVVLGIIRYIFWSGWTLLAVLLIAGGITVYSVFADDYDYSQSQPTTEYVQYDTERYVCTARVLNVRSAASSSASVKGTLKEGQVCEVVSFSNGFAKIKYGSSYGYVSASYIKKR